MAVLRVAPSEPTEHIQHEIAAKSRPSRRPAVGYASAQYLSSAMTPTWERGARELDACRGAHEKGGDTGRGASHRRHSGPDWPHQALRHACDHRVAVRATLPRRCAFVLPIGSSVEQASSLNHSQRPPTRLFWRFYTSMPEPHSSMGIGRGVPSRSSCFCHTEVTISTASQAVSNATNHQMKPEMGHYGSLRAHIHHPLCPRSVVLDGTFSVHGRVDPFRHHRWPRTHPARECLLSRSKFASLQK